MYGFCSNKALCWAGLSFKMFIWQPTVVGRALQNKVCPSFCLPGCFLRIQSLAFSKYLHGARKPYKFKWHTRGLLSQDGLLKTAYSEKRSFCYVFLLIFVFWNSSMLQVFVSCICCFLALIFVCAIMLNLYMQQMCYIGHGE